MSPQKRVQLEQLMYKSITENKHDDTVLLLTSLYEGAPMTPDELLVKINSLFKHFNKTPWAAADLDISRKLLLSRGLIEAGQ